MVNYSGSENIGNVKHLRHNDGQQTHFDQKSLFESLAEMRNGIKYKATNKTKDRTDRNSYLNINSVRHNIGNIKEFLHKNITDILFLAETKIGNSFPDCQFAVDNYTMWRADRNSHGGGLMAFMRSSLAGDRKIDFGFKNIESITIEIRTETDRLCFTEVYKPPSMKHDVFKTDISNTCENLLSRYDNLFILGDLNYDMLDKDKSSNLVDICDIYDIRNHIRAPTCFMGTSKPSLLDVILTNKSKLVNKTLNFSSGLSDFHNCITVQVNCTVNSNKKQTKLCRSFKDFDSENFIQDLENGRF
jgi:hypothetical protein